MPEPGCPAGMGPTMEIGSLADWFSAAGTVSAVVLTLCLLFAERRRRRGELAARISVWTEWLREPGGHNLEPRQYFAYVDNSGDSPVYVDLMEVRARPGGEVLDKVEIATVAAHDRSPYGLSEKTFPPTADPPFVEIFFADVNGARWRRNSRGELLPVPGSRPH